MPLFRQATLTQLAVISLMAGLGEELLFRGVIQGKITQVVGGPAGNWVGAIVAALLFGLAHSVSLTYAILAALIGLYLSWTWLATGNLLVPIAAHTVYDFVALVYLVKVRSR